MRTSQLPLAEPVHINTEALSQIVDRASERGGERDFASAETLDRRGHDVYLIR